MTDEQRRGYAAAVWEHFTARTGRTERLMSAGEWWTLSRWMDLEIPLRVVLRGMDDSARRALNLAWYDGPVRDAYDRWRRALYS